MRHKGRDWLRREIPAGRVQARNRRGEIVPERALEPIESVTRMVYDRNHFGQNHDAVFIPISVARVRFLEGE